MEKEKFIYLFKFNFNNKKFKIFWNSNTEYFPLEIINNQLVYPDYDDYIAIYKIFEKTFLFNVKGKKFNMSTTSPQENNHKDNNRNINKIKYYVFRPLVRKAALGLISFALALALSISSCGLAYSDSTKKEAELAERIESTIESAKENDKEIEYNETFQRFFVKKYFDTDLNKNVIIVDSINDMRKYLPDENQNPSFVDLHNTIDNNPNIHSELKEKFHEIINNLEKNLPNFDIFILNYNLSRVDTYYTGIDDCEEENRVGELASFNPYTGLIELDYKNLPQEILAHEIAHCGTLTYVEIDEKTGVYLTMVPVIYNTYRDTVVFHSGPDEGFCDLFSLAGADMTQFVLKENEGDWYASFTEGMNIILKSIGWSLEDYSNHSVIDFLETIHNRGIKDPVGMLSRLTTDVYNTYFDGIEYDPEAYGLEDWVYDYVYEIGEHDILNDEYDSSKINSLFDNPSYSGEIRAYCTLKDGTRILVEKYNGEEVRERLIGNLDTVNKKKHPKSIFDFGREK